jgi:maltose phosphorylase
LRFKVSQKETTFSLEGNSEISVFVNGNNVLVEPDSLVTV